MLIRSASIFTVMRDSYMRFISVWFSQLSLTWRVLFTNMKFIRHNFSSRYSAGSLAIFLLRNDKRTNATVDQASVALRIITLTLASSENRQLARANNINQFAVTQQLNLQVQLA